MNSSPKTWPVLLSVLALMGLVLGWLAWSRVRSSQTAEQLLKHLPPNAEIYAFLDVELMRRTGVLDRLAGARGQEDADYQRFVARSGFNYRQHLDAVMMARRGKAQYAVIAGRFDAARLEAYATESAGVCAARYCYVPGAPPISFVPIRQGVYAFASGAGDARELLAAHAPGLSGEFLGSPVWAAGLSPAEVPLLQALPGVERMSLWLTPRLPASVEMRFALDIHDAASASTVARELNTLSKASDLSRYLSAGEAVAEGKRVHGRLPLAVSLLEALVSGTRLR
ncbi:MAG: hypothetical protein K2X03_10550 [Bryobacteraceae bacterium]|nr:hypothetical protein [Bryobacteraceae bacterium]